MASGELPAGLSLPPPVALAAVPVVPLGPFQQPPRTSRVGGAVSAGQTAAASAAVGTGAYTAVGAVVAATLTATGLLRGRGRAPSRRCRSASAGPRAGVHGVRQSGARTARVALASSYDVEAWRRGFCEVEDPEGGFYFLEGIEDIPEDLRGTLWRNGPSNFVVGGVKINHPLDGDGLMLGVSFCGDGKVCVRHRPVQTQGHIRDVLEKRIVTPGFFGTEAQGGKLFDLRKGQVKNTANTGLIWWKQRLLALWPFGKPFEVDPYALGTVIGNQENGSTDIGKLLDDDVPFGATPKVCATTGDLVNFAQLPQALGTAVTFYELPEDEWRPRSRLPRILRLDSYTNLMDFAVTPTWFVVAQPPLNANGIAATFGKNMPEVLSYDPNGVGELIFVSRSKKANREVKVPVDNLVCQEFANAYELEDGRVVLDVVAAERWDIAPFWEGARPRTRLVRYEVDVKNETWTKRDLCSKHLEFTSVNASVIGKPHRFVFAAVAHSDSEAGPVAGVAKVDTESGEIDAWVPGPAEFGGQPVFVPRPGSTAEDDGYLVTAVYDGAANRSDIVVLDARSVSKGPVCRFSLKAPVPHGLRSLWAEGFAPTPEEMKRKTTLLKMYKRKSNEWNQANTNFAMIAANPFFEQSGTKWR